MKILEDTRTILTILAPNWGYSLRYKNKSTAGADSASLTNSGAINNITIFSVELLLSSTFNPAIARRRLLVR